MPEAPLSPDAIADLATGGETPPGAPPPGLSATARAVRALRAAADLLEVHGDILQGENLSVTVLGGNPAWAVAITGPAGARAILRADGIRLTDWYGTAGSRLRELRVTWDGVLFGGTQHADTCGCGYCGGTGLHPEPEMLPGDGAVACAACAGAP